MRGRGREITGVKQSAGETGLVRAGEWCPGGPEKNVCACWISRVECLKMCK